MSFQVGDVVRVINSQNGHTGKIGTIVHFSDRAISGRPTEHYYSGWRLVPVMKNMYDNEIYWRESQIKKINPPDWRADVQRTEERLA